MQRRFLGFAALLLLAGCGGGVSSSLSTADTLRTVSSRVLVGGQTVSGTTTLWRDVMPGPGAATRGMIATFSVNPVSGTTVPAGLHAVRVSLVKGQEVFVSTVLEEQQGPSNYTVTLRNGPVWDVGSSVDVVLEFVDSAGASYSIRATGVLLNGVF